MKKLFALMLVLALSPFIAIGEGYEHVFDPAKDEGQFVVRFLWLGEWIDAKPGECIILKSPDGKVMVLDAGYPNVVSYVTEALDALGITCIDYLVASHPHEDHVGGFPVLIKKYEIGTMYTSPLTFEASSYYQAYLTAAQEKGLEHIILHEGDTFMFGKEIEVKVFNPPEEIQYPKDYEINPTKFINDHSLTMKFTYGARSLMLAGDLYMSGEWAVIDRWNGELACDFMKANHHGSNTSSSSAWRKAVGPKITFITNAIIEDLNVTKRFTKEGQQMYHTLLDGSIRLAINKDGSYEVTTEKKRTRTIFDSN